jgi:hypothetical protein
VCVGGGGACAGAGAKQQQPVQLWWSHREALSMAVASSTWLDPVLFSR